MDGHVLVSLLTLALSWFRLDPCQDTTSRATLAGLAPQPQALSKEELLQMLIATKLELAEQKRERTPQHALSVRMVTPRRAQTYSCRFRDRSWCCATV